MDLSPNPQISYDLIFLPTSPIQAILGEFLFSFLSCLHSSTVPHFLSVPSCLQCVLPLIHPSLHLSCCTYGKATSRRRGSHFVLKPMRLVVFLISSTTKCQSLGPIIERALFPAATNFNRQVDTFLGPDE